MQYFRRAGDFSNRNVAKGETVYFKNRADRYKAVAGAFAWQRETLTDPTPGASPPTFLTQGNSHQEGRSGDAAHGDRARRGRPGGDPAHGRGHPGHGYRPRLVGESLRPRRDVLQNGRSWPAAAAGRRAFRFKWEIRVGIFWGAPWSSKGGVRCSR